MDFRIILFIVVFLLGYVFASVNPYSKKHIKWYIITVFGLLILESAFRDYHIGPDTMNYYNEFKHIDNLSLNDIIQRIYNTYILGQSDNVRDIGYLLYQKSIHLFSHNFTTLLFISALIFFIPLGIILNKYCSSIYHLIFAFCLYISLFHIIALSGIRQQIAMGITFIVTLLVPQRKYLPIIILFLIALTIHKSFAIFLLMPLTFLFLQKYTNKLHLISLWIAPIMFIAGTALVVYMASFTSQADYYAGYAETVNGGAMNYIVMMLTLSLFCYIAFKRENPTIDNFNLLYAATPWLTIFVPLIHINGGLIRVGQYFTIYMMILFPYAVEIIFPKSSRIVLCSCSLILVWLALRSEYVYHFISF